MKAFDWTELEFEMLSPLLWRGTWQYTGRHGVGEVAQKSLFAGNKERDN